MVSTEIYSIWRKCVRMRNLGILGLLLSYLVAACSNPFLPAAPPPQPGKVLYALYDLWDRPIHSRADLAHASVTLTVKAMSSSDGQAIWQTSVLTGSAVNSLSSASIISAGSTVFVAISTPQATAPSQKAGPKGQVIALDALSGQIRWQSKLDGARIWQPTAANGNLYMEVDDKIEALDGASGQLLWSDLPDAGYHTGDLVVTKNAVYVAQEADFLPAAQRETYDSVILRAFRLNDGKELWRREVANTLKEGWISLEHVSIQADEQTIYVLSVGQVMEITHYGGTDYPRYTLFTLHAQDGSPVWSNPTQRPAEGPQEFSLALSNHVLYLVGVDNPGTNTLSTFQSQDGKLLSKWQTPLIINPFKAPNHVYGSSLNKGESFCALSVSDGHKTWCGPYNQAGAALFSEGKVYLYAYKVNSPGSSNIEQPAQIYVLRESDGSLVAHYPPDDVARTVMMDITLS